MSDVYNGGTQHVKSDMTAEAYKARAKADLEALTKINLRQEKRVRNLESKAILLAISYLFIQTLIFNAVSQQSSTIKCSKWWIPMSLSLSVALLFFLTFVVTLGKYMDTSYEYDLNLLDAEMLHRDTIVGPRHKIDLDGYDRMVLRPDMLRVYKRYAFKYVTLGCLLAFTVILLFACRSIVC